MAFESSSGRFGARKNVNITPLIDVVLVLLIIFMVTTPTSLKHLTPTLAQESSPSTQVSSPVTVEMSAAGAVTVNGSDTDWAHLQDLVRSRLSQSRQSAVLLEISDEVDYGRAIRLMDLCKGAGAATVGVSPRPRAI